MECAQCVVEKSVLLGEQGPEGSGRSEEHDSLGAGRAFWVSRHPEEVE